MSVSALQSPSRTSSSPSPVRRTLGDKIAALGARLSRTLSHTDEQREEEDSFSVESFPVSYTKPKDRSASRGREAFQSTGRGGLGNIRQASLSRDARPDNGPDDFSVTRGREAISNPNQTFSTGRGGAGNIHSPTRDASVVRGRSSGTDAALNEQSVIREYAAAHEHAPVSSGRGGRGNIITSASAAAGLREEARESASRSRSRPPAVHSTGRGGAGNIRLGDGLAAAQAAEAEEAERRRTPHEGPHSTGRGGLANISALAEPPIERTPHHAPSTGPHYESTGRGGAGNIRQERSASRPRA